MELNNNGMEPAGEVEAHRCFGSREPREKLRARKRANCQKDPLQTRTT